MELPDETYARIEALSGKGNALLDGEDWAGAVLVWKEALNLIPEPKADWEATLWLCASIGDAFYTGKQYKEAVDYLYDALNAPEGQGNPFVHLRLGQSLIALGDVEKGVGSLHKAYMLDGAQIFEMEEDSRKYLKLLAERDLL